MQSMIKDAVTNEMKEWLVKYVIFATQPHMLPPPPPSPPIITLYFFFFLTQRVRETSRVIGAMAMTHMQDRQDRWRAKTAEDPKLKSVQHHNVNSAIEQVVNEADESK